MLLLCMERNLLSIPEESLELAFFQVGCSDRFPPGWIHKKTVHYGIIGQACAGEYEITCSGQTVRVRAPQAFLTPAHSPLSIVHHADRRKRFAARWLHFSFLVYQTIDLTSLMEMPLQIPARQGRELGAIIQELLQSEKEGLLEAFSQSIRRRELLWRVLRIVSDLSRFKPEALELLKAGKRLAPLLAHLKNNFSTPLSISQMSELANMSTSRFFAYFQTKMGCSPMEYSKRIRLNAAAAQFSLTDRLIKEVADDTGFANPFHLSREFKRRFGLSPKQYRAVNLVS
jgi:AraC-like DNA-binding protein